MPLHDRASPPTIPTPPPTTLDDHESPTTSVLNLNTGAGPPDMPHSGITFKRPLYLIVATAVEPHLGIGLGGSLPWKGLKTDMGFFRRVTLGETGKTHPEMVKDVRSARNAVIMGRRTWESIPRKFRPLKGRVNVVVTRDISRLETQIKREARAGDEAEEDNMLVVSSLTNGLERLDELRERQNDFAIREAKDFVIGGSEIYKAALDLAAPPYSSPQQDSNDGVLLRVLQTQVRKKDGEAFECDTFFPVALQQNDKGITAAFRLVDTAEAESWAGEALPQRGADWALDDGGECEIRVVGWEMIG
jgi:dihydrofolate reductase